MWTQYHVLNEEDIGCVWCECTLDKCVFCMISLMPDNVDPNDLNLCSYCGYLISKDNWMALLGRRTVQDGRGCGADVIYNSHEETVSRRDSTFRSILAANLSSIPGHVITANMAVRIEKWSNSA